MAYACCLSKSGIWGQPQGLQDFSSRGLTCLVGCNLSSPYVTRQRGNREAGANTFCLGLGKRLGSMSDNAWLRDQFSSGIEALLVRGSEPGGYTYQFALIGYRWQEEQGIIGHSSLRLWAWLTDRTQGHSCRFRTHYNRSSRILNFYGLCWLRPIYRL